jgi:hypothetical protein
MTEAPTGRLAWGQAGVYDAVDDRAVIAAVTRNRTGLTWPSSPRAGAGLQVVVPGPWLGVASCGDGTSGVVGSRLDLVVMASPGPATGSREDVLWCDVEPDEAEWSLVIIPASDVPSRPGIALGYITVPAGATLASQMDIRSAGAMLERRLPGFAEFTDTRTSSGNSWLTADTIAWCNVTIEPGQWYRARFTATSPTAVTGSLDGRIGLGWRPGGAPNSQSQLVRASVIGYPRIGTGCSVEVEYVFRHPPDAAAAARIYDGRIWINGTGTYRVQGVTGQGPGLAITVEDLGS